MSKASFASLAFFGTLFAISLTLASSHADNLPIDQGQGGTGGGATLTPFVAQELEFETGTIVSQQEFHPKIGEAFLVFAARALTRAEAASMAAGGLRCLGLVHGHVYTFVATSQNPSALAALRAMAIHGMAEFRGQDRLSRELQTRLAGANASERFDIALSLWPSTTRAEALALTPKSLALELPDNPNESIAGDTILRLSASKAEIETMIVKPCVAGASLVVPRRILNHISRARSHADVLATTPWNLDGAGITVGIWDGAEVDTHSDFDTRLTVLDLGGVSSHSTHVAGTIGGSGAGNASARGFAPAAKLLSYDFGGNVFGERRTALHTYQHLLDNHSWGGDTTIFGGYSADSQSFDLDARDLLMIAVKAAGNDGSISEVTHGGQNFDSIVPDSTSKNALIIGNFNDNLSIASSSARGPTDDGRIKPDLCANGDNLISTRPNNAYGTSSGTSMASPSASGALALVAQRYAQLHNNERIKPDTARTLLLHTAADGYNTGPDFLFGWGLLDARAAVELLEADAAAGRRHLIRGALRDGEVDAFELDVPAGQASLKVTVSWLDNYSATSASKRLVHDLDLILESPTGFLFHPWTLDASQPSNPAIQVGKNDRDNIEQVVVTSPLAGRWKIRVSGAAIGDLSLPVQGYSLAASHPLDHLSNRLYTPLGFPLALPDNSPQGVELSFDANAVFGKIREVRVGVDITHGRRGDLRVVLMGPGGQSQTIEADDTNTKDDLYAVFPDVRSFDDDLAVFKGLFSNGLWTLTISDRRSGTTGEIRDAWLELDLEAQDLPPVAMVTTPLSVFSHQRVTLNGAASADPESAPLTYQWTQTSGPAVTLEGAATSTPIFTAPDVAAQSVLTFSLLVKDPALQTGMASVTVNLAPNSRPDADAGPDQQVISGALVLLNGGASSDGDGDILAFQWNQTTGQSVTLLNGSTSQASFIAPLVSATESVTFTLWTTDTHGVADSDSIAITLEPLPPNAPQINEVMPTMPRAGGTMTIMGMNLLDATVTLNGEALMIHSQSANQIEVLIPSDFPANSDQSLVVTSATGSFTVLLNIAPQIITNAGSGGGGGGCNLRQSLEWWWLGLFCAIWACYSFMKRNWWSNSTG